MQQHPLIGENIVAPLRSGASLLPIIRHHHERFDGGGYPDRLSGAGIPRLARVVAVCDAFDALVNDRPYRARKTLDEAVATLRAGAGTQWDPEVVSLFASDIPSCARQGAASLAAASVTLIAAQALSLNRAAVLAIAVAWLLVWCVCVGEPIVRFWLVARRLPAVQGWRLRSLSLGFGGLVLVLLLAISIGVFVRQVVVQVGIEVVVLTIVPLLYASFSPPAWLRRQWRAEEEEGLPALMEGLLPSEG